MEVDRHRAGLHRSLRHHHNVATMQQSRSFMDRHRSELHHSNWRMGKVMQEAELKVFQIETTLNTDIFPDPFVLLAKREWEWSQGPRHLPRDDEGAEANARARKRRSSSRWSHRTR